MNKKLLALLLAILMVAMSAVAMAATKNQTTLSDITKIYTTDTELPVETLTFTATAQSAVKADGTPVTENIGAPTLTGSIATSNMTEDATVNRQYTAAVSISSSATWPFAGTYTYSVSENAGNIQGVTYADNSIAFKVLVGYAEVDGKPSQTLEAQDIQLVAVNGKKEGSFTNAYNSGSVKVTKTVSGNAASTTDTFNVDVTFAVASGNVFSENVQIGGISGQTISEDKTTITGTITVKHGDEITLSNIPVGTTVTVAENDPKVNTANSTDATKYTATYNGNGAVVSSAAQTIAITNTRTSSIDTGVTTDSMPYILLMAFVAILAVAFVAKKRSVKE